MRDDILRSVAQQIDCISRKLFQNLSRDSTPALPLPPLQTYDSDFELNAEAPLPFTDLLSSSKILSRNRISTPYSLTRTSPQ
jgi:hypothetical protein